jgi:hypothetical protein
MGRGKEEMKEGYAAFLEVWPGQILLAAVVGLKVEYDEDFHNEVANFTEEQDIYFGEKEFKMSDRLQPGHYSSIQHLYDDKTGYKLLTKNEARRDLFSKVFTDEDLQEQ